MNTNLGLIFKKYFVATIIAIAGLYMIGVGFSSGQDSLFIMAAFTLFIGGVLSILLSAGILGKNVVFGIGAACILVAIIIGYQSIVSVDNTIAHEKAYKKSEALNIYTLNQIRDIQRAYKAENGRYAHDFDELFDFFNNSKITKIDAMGSVPSRRLTVQERDVLYSDKRALDKNMTEREAALLVAQGNPTNSSDLTNFKRDTIKVYFKDEFLDSKTRESTREALGLPITFDIDELRFIPMTDPKEEWTIKTVDRLPYLGNDTIATIHVYGKRAVPYFEKGERSIIGFGNLKTSSDKGTWE